MGGLGSTRFPWNMPPLRIWSMEKLCVPRDENSCVTFAFKDSVAVTMAINAMMPMPMMPMVKVVRRACPRIDRSATRVISRHKEAGCLMSLGPSS